MTPYMYIVVRTDLKKEFQLVQACHAAIEAAFTFDRPDDITHLVVLQVANERELEEVSLQLYNENIPYEDFFESWGNLRTTALATKPITKQKEGILSKLSLLTY
jgi:peptidyl-tRNA hydrolase